MLRRLQAFLVWGVWLVTVPAAAQESSDQDAPDSAPTRTGTDARDEPTAEKPTSEPASPDLASAGAHVEPAAPAPSAQVKPAAEPEGWQTFASGYFRAPLAIGISPRPGPDDLNGPSSTQLSYGPNRTVDANYYSFAYTRLQEQDWAEVFIHAKKKHVEAVVGWMGYWYQGAGFRNYDAAWAPGMAYLTLDTDFGALGLKPNIALTGGAFWPKFGYVEKYDTYTLGRFRHLGEQLKLTVPLNSELTLTLVQGFGAGRDGSFNLLAPPPYQATVGLSLLHYEHVQLTYEKYLDLGLHYNSQWTRDPNLTQTTVPGKAYTDAREAYLTTVGGEASVSAPRVGRLWISPSYVRVKNGWALGEAGVEVMHSLSAEGLATNYMAWSGSIPDSTGSGSMLNLGFLYENTLSGIQGRAPGSSLPEVTLNVFGLLANASLDLPAGSVISQDRIGQFKYGADLTVQALKWLGFMLRWDEVNYDLDHSGYVFSAITPRVTFSSHFLSGESLYLQYSRYRYGDKMVLAGRWPWGLPLVAGSDIVQGGSYAGKTPDMDVVKLQAEVAF
jgi:hypothetical protein